MGPCLVIMPYPPTDGSAGADMAGMEVIPETILSIANMSSASQSSNMSRELQLSDMDSILQSSDMGSAFNLSDIIDVEEMSSINLTD